MAIYKGSRYEYSTVDYVTTTYGGSQNPIVFYIIDSPSVSTYYEHTYIEGERLDQIANTYYKNPLYWWIIPEFNPQLTDFTNIPGGTVIRIPNV